MGQTVALRAQVLSSSYMSDTRPIRLDLEASEAALLREAVDRAAHELQEELVRTTDRAHRADLRARVERLEAIGIRLGGTIAGQSQRS